jgi:hypothetical protein
MATTPTYGWTTPNDSDPFKDGALAIRNLGNAIDSSVRGLGQGDISYTRNVGATLTLTTSTETELFRAPAFTPIAGRLYEMTVTVGYVQKITGGGNIDIRLRMNSTSGTILDQGLYSATPVGMIFVHSKTTIQTSTQMGTSAFTPICTVQTNTNGVTAANSAQLVGSIIFKDIGVA